MGDVQLTVRPSDELVKGAIAEFEVKDARGRVIKLRKPGILAQFRLVKILGEAAKNEVYMSMVLPMIFVAELDGDPVSFPQTEREIEALITRLDEDGVAAVMKGVQENFGEQDAKKAETDIKN